MVTEKSNVSVTGLLLVVTANTKTTYDPLGSVLISGAKAVPFAPKDAKVIPPVLTATV